MQLSQGGGGAKKSENNNPERYIFFNNKSRLWFKMTQNNYDVQWKNTFDINKKSDHLQDAHSQK